MERDLCDHLQVAEADDPTVIVAVQSLLDLAVTQEASELGVVPCDAPGIVIVKKPIMMALYIRKKGVVRQIGEIPEAMHAGFVARIKRLAGMNVEQTEQPQQGNLEWVCGDRRVQLSVFSTPGPDGERIVLKSAWSP